MADNTPIFDNNKVTELVLQYQKNSTDMILMGEILKGCQELLGVTATSIQSKYLGEHDSALMEDLTQEANIKILEKIEQWNPERGSKLYSWISVVARNAMIDYLRTQKPALQLDDSMLNIPEDDDEQDSEFTAIVAENLRDWLIKRFPSLVDRERAGNILLTLLNDLINPEVSNKATVDNLIAEHELTKTEAQLLLEAIIVNLRIANSRSIYMRDSTPPEDSLEPELLVLLGDNDYLRLMEAFEGTSFKFK